MGKGRRKGSSSTKKKKKKKSSSQRQESEGDSGDNFVWVDPNRIRFQHARIRPHFSSCGRSLQGTLSDIRTGVMRPDDLPPIQVLAGPTTPQDDDDDDGGGPWYFSLNNRRLWVLKQCRREGLLENIRVRVRQPRSRAEAERYTLEKCAAEAKIVREKRPSKKKGRNDHDRKKTMKDADDDGSDDAMPNLENLESVSHEKVPSNSEEAPGTDDEEESGDDDTSGGSEDDMLPDDGASSRTNRFEALF
jgi:hypothetical protein